MTKKSKQPALPLEGMAKPDPQPLFDGGPKEPIVGRHEAFHFLSWAFHKHRFEQIGDRHFDPWLPKHLKSCQRVMKMARGDRAEVKRRMENLWKWMVVNPDYYRFTPEELLGKWDDLHMPPADSVGGRSAMRKQLRDTKFAQRMRELGAQ